MPCLFNYFLQHQGFTYYFASDFLTLKQILCQALHAVILYRRGRATFCVVWVQLTIFLLYEFVKRLRIILF